MFTDLVHIRRLYRFSIVVDKDRALECQEKMINCLRSYFDEEVFVTIGFQGGNVKGKVLYSNSLGIWIHSENLGNKTWNGFGIGRPTEGSNLSIVCEINIPLKGIDRRIQGEFVENSTGEVYLIHRGKIGGGKSGIGRTLFQQNYQGQWIQFQDGNLVSNASQVGKINNILCAEQIRDFVFEINAMKNKIS